MIIPILQRRVNNLSKVAGLLESQSWALNSGTVILELDLSSVLFLLKQFVITRFKPVFVSNHSGSPLGVWSSTMQTTKEI